MGLWAWFCRRACAGTIAAELERQQREQDEQVEQLKAEAMRRTDPGKVRAAALSKLAELMRAGTAVLIIGGCHDLSPRQQEQVDVVKCRVAAVAPLLEAVCDPEHVVVEAMMGRVDVARALLGAGATLDEVREAGLRWNACAPSPVGQDGG